MPAHNVRSREILRISASPSHRKPEAILPVPCHTRMIQVTVRNIQYSKGASPRHVRASSPRGPGPNCCNRDIGPAVVSSLDPAKSLTRARLLPRRVRGSGYVALKVLRYSPGGSGVLRLGVPGDRDHPYHPQRAPCLALASHGLVRREIMSALLCFILFRGVNRGAESTD
jgi:hypothetical protein